MVLLFAKISSAAPNRCFEYHYKPPHGLSMDIICYILLLVMKIHTEATRRVRARTLELKHGYDPTTSVLQRSKICHRRRESKFCSSTTAVWFTEQVRWVTWWGLQCMCLELYSTAVTRRITPPPPPHTRRDSSQFSRQAQGFRVNVLF